MADHLAAQVAELRRDLDQARAELAIAQAGRLDDRGRAERAEAMATSWEQRATDATARLDRAEMELRESRRPWWERMVHAFRR